MKTLAFIGAWALYFVGDLAGRFDHRSRLAQRIYPRAISLSSRLQDYAGRGPWQVVG